MLNPQLLQYVRAQRAACVSKEDITKALAGGGWSASDAQEAFAAIDGPATPPPPPRPPAPAAVPVAAAPVTAAPIQPRPAAAAYTPQPAAVRVQPAAVVQPRPTYAPQVKRRAKWPWVLLFLIIFFILGIGAGAYATVKYDWFAGLVRMAAGIQEPAPAEDMTQVANEGDQGGFLEVSPEPFDTLTPSDQNSSSTPATTTPATTTPTSGR